MRTDVHNRAIPEAALEPLRRDTTYGVTLADRHWSGGIHVDFEIADAFLKSGAKLAELEEQGIEAAVVSVAPPPIYYHLEADAGASMTVRSTTVSPISRRRSRAGSHGFASVPLQFTEAAIAVLAETADAGCVGDRDRRPGPSARRPRAGAVAAGGRAAAPGLGRRRPAIAEVHPRSLYRLPTEGTTSHA